MAVLDFNGLSHFKDKIYNLISSALSKKVDKVNGKGLSQNDLTNELKQKYDSAYAHSTSNHAPSNAQENEIEEIKLNGNVITPNSKSVDITGVSLINHNHDDRYYTESEINTKLNSKANSSHTHGNSDITALDAAKITSGTISIERLPKGALERCIVVADDTARLALTTSSVQTGDTVKVSSTGIMYFVVDDSKLSSESGYEVYTAGSATSVPWSGVTGKPSSYTPSSHTQAISTITGLQSALDGKSATSHTHDDRYYTESEINTKLNSKSDTSHTHDLSTMINTLSTETSTPTDNDYYVSQYAGGGTTTTTYHRRPVSALWSYIKSKLATVATSGSYNDLRNKPTIPTVGNGTITITQGGTTKGTFTTNQSGNTTIALTDNNTTYSAATQSANGLMSASDKKKLDGISTGAQVNQNAFSNVVVGSTTVAADNATDTLTLVGNNVTLTPDATNDKVTIGITKANVTSALGYTPPTTNTTYSAATSSANGLMSSADKAKLDAITASADAVSFTRSLTSGTKVGTITINGTGADLYAPTNTDTHYTTHLKVGASATATANAAATNGNVYINALDNTTVRDSHKIVGSGATTVTSDENGVITINSTNTNTTYSSGRGITLSGTQFKLNDNCTIITDWDDAVTTGWYMASNASNAPVTSGGWFYGEVIAHNTKYVRQILYHFATNSDVTGTNCDRYERVKHNDTWGLWVNTSVRTAVPANAKFINNIYCQTTEPSVSDTVVWLPYS